MIKNKKTLYHNPKIFSTTQKKKREYNIPPIYIWSSLIVILMAGLVWFVFYSEYFKINEIEITGSLNNEVKSSIDSFRGKNIITFNPGKIQEELPQKQTSIKNLEIKRGLPNVLKIKVNVREPVLGWISQGKKYYIDEKGIVFELSEGQAIASDLPTIEDKKNLPVNLRTEIVTENFVLFINAMIKKFNEINIKINAIRIEETTFQVELDTDQGYKLLISTTNSLENQIKVLDEVIKSKRQDVKEYIDLRIEGRAYYK